MSEQLKFVKNDKWLDETNLIHEGEFEEVTEVKQIEHEQS